MALLALCLCLDGCGLVRAGLWSRHISSYYGSDFNLDINIEISDPTPTPTLAPNTILTHFSYDCTQPLRIADVFVCLYLEKLRNSFTPKSTTGKAVTHRSKK